MTSLVAEFALASISMKLALWNLFLRLAAVLLSVMEPAYWAKGSSGSGVGVGAIIESAQATHASQVETEAVAEDVVVDKALADVTDETISADELLVTRPLDGATEEPAAELAETVGDDCVADGWLADGCWTVGLGLSGPAFSIA